MHILFYIVVILICSFVR